VSCRKKSPLLSRGKGRPPRFPASPSQLRLGECAAIPAHPNAGRRQNQWVQLTVSCNVLSSSGGSASKIDRHTDSEYRSFAEARLNAEVVAEHLRGTAHDRQPQA
jgi:hypothetical protein